MDYDSYSSTTAVDTGVAGAIMAFMGMYFVVILLVVVFALVCMWRVFAKAGQPGWAALVPIYNIYILMLVIGKPWWWMFIAFASVIPVVGYIIVLAWGIIVALELGNKFGKSNVFSIVGLWLFSIVGYAILAFGSAEYNPSAPPVTNFLTGGTPDPAAAQPQAAPAPAPAPAQPVYQPAPEQPVTQEVSEVPMAKSMEDSTAIDESVTQVEQPSDEGVPPTV